MATVGGGLQDAVASGQYSPNLFTYFTGNIPRNQFSDPVRERDYSTRPGAQIVSGTKGNDQVTLGRGDTLKQVPGGHASGYDTAISKYSIDLTGTGFRSAILTGSSNAK